MLFACRPAHKLIGGAVFKVIELRGGGINSEYFFLYFDLKVLLVWFIYRYVHIKNGGYQRPKCMQI